jgi:hypothetical protein
VVEECASGYLYHPDSHTSFWQKEKRASNCLLWDHHMKKVADKNRLSILDQQTLGDISPAHRHLRPGKVGR